MAIIKDIVRLYYIHNIPKASAALSYYMTMTFFPLIVCLYALFGQSYSTALRIVEFTGQFLTPDATSMIRNYLLYLAGSSGKAILVAAITILFTSASATIRAMESTVSDIQGGHRFRVWQDFLLSFLLAVALLIAMYFALTVMLTGRDMLDKLHESFPDLDISAAWAWSRFPFLGSIALAILWGAFAFMKNEPFPTWPGAILSAVSIMGMSGLFSVFIAASTRYSLVYESLASLILLMLCLYMACQLIFVGAAFNVALRNRSARLRSTKKQAPG